MGGCGWRMQPDGEDDSAVTTRGKTECGCLIRALRGVTSVDEWVSGENAGDDSGEGRDDHECERVRDTSENVRTRR